MNAKDINVSSAPSENLISFSVPSLYSIPSPSVGYSSKSGTRFQSYVSGSFLCGSFSSIGFGVEGTFGVVLNPYLYVGGMTGIRDYAAKGLDDEDDFWDDEEGRIHALHLPVTGYVRGMLPLDKVTLFAECAIGASIGLKNLKGADFYTEFGVGAELGRYSVCLGYNGIVDVGTFSGMYIKAAVRFGR